MHVRLTPACAGSTSSRHPWAAPWPTYPRVCGEHRTVHPLPRPRIRLTPRVCGEHATPSAFRIVVYDLPPRVRGARPCSGSRRGLLRLTPACAGEHRLHQSVHSAMCDLPPRVRGAHRNSRAVIDERRLTPACVGSTCSRLAAPMRPPTYPRVCGEHHSRPAACNDSSDLPPRVRGALQEMRLNAHSLRLTPACAGSTRLQAHWFGCETTYPRVCGEHSSGASSAAATVDLPPRVRGARQRDQQRRDPHRLTPACAGSTPVDLELDVQVPTYPRVCGEHTS